MLLTVHFQQQALKIYVKNTINHKTQPIRTGLWVCVLGSSDHTVELCWCSLALARCHSCHWKSTNESCHTVISYINFTTVFQALPKGCFTLAQQNSKIQKLTMLSVSLYQPALTARTQLSHKKHTICGNQPYHCNALLMAFLFFFHFYNFKFYKI